MKTIIPLTIEECGKFLEFLWRLPMNGAQQDAANVVAGAIGQYVARNMPKRSEG